MQNVLALLASYQQLSLTELTALLGYSEQDILHNIEKLKQQGIQIEQQVQHFRLIPQLNRLNASYLTQALAPYPLYIKPIINSTNQFLLDNIAHLEKGAICLAEYQTAGRGRRGRQWLSPFAGQVIMSLYWTCDQKVNLEGLSLVVGMAIAETLKQAGALNIGLKWPNDVLLHGRKLAGILVEIANRQNNQHHLVIGFGINLSFPKQTQQIDQPWAELIEILPTIDRNKLIAELGKKLIARLQHFEQAGIDEAFRQDWRDMDAYFGEEVHVLTENHKITGIAQGIDKRGYLQLITSEGMQYFNGGEVSLRKAS
ncbi:bifunctional biotin--[acetyl-CoA-carboxylase] ligase/biotin operon repressor BirA [Pasteurella multocida]|uniref:bifunctional biotin--[acetyl-CoA-carboxylase] ligase/biotin operon repressor BirA n=1 Tax=Pasteurella multocida TaxID=747 RepID=UPI0020252DEA|nr:bifunctional biotin--[acetyl-CoA-carboxylase] ligase/biotin operon repressor BirA [Pasteurella multocida]URJ86999.1 bifunctional biotin--[acetyl-CoA-carboxylase] ligase/biotin operon repressor BirA [Pasteurella multocida]URJ88986.1 bifunctional biotin--[acetyl-CoA-carboxylase] ligase/biotin operon repressor BirA [Pasteurella multocida]HDR0619249.1 bifunctional biotin--[acetyl-CoA-carboxylase] ligase/biotin operon repressor BirA [Pasteurella multocida]